MCAWERDYVLDTHKNSHCLYGSTYAFVFVSLFLALRQADVDDVFS